MERYTEIKRLIREAVTQWADDRPHEAHATVQRALEHGMTAHDFTENTPMAFRADMRKRQRAGEFA